MEHSPKEKLLYIMEVLKEHSDEDHPLTAPAISRILSDEYGIEAERKSIRRDIKVLESTGLTEDVDTKGIPQDRRGTYYADRPFEDWQLKLLIDAVNHALFLSDKDARQMTETLLRMTGPGSRALLKSNMQQHESVHATGFRYVLDTLLKSIKDEVQVSFKYFDLDENGEKIYRKDARRYLVNPYHVFWVNRNYYLICNTHGKDGLSSYRLDKMDSARISETARIPVSRLPKGDLTEKAERYPTDNASQFMGDSIPVDVRCEKKWLGSVRDVFGYNNVKKIPGTEDNYKILTVDSEGLYISLMHLGERIQVLGPEKVRITLTEKLRNILNMYE